MCAIILKVLFLGGLVAGVSLTIAALVLPDWRVYGDVAYWGLFQNCTNEGTTKAAKYNCVNAWSGAPMWRQAVAGCLMASVCLSALAFGWWLLACIGCCCQQFLAPPLPIFAVLACLLDVAAVSVYAAKFRDDPHGNGRLLDKSEYGLAFWLAVGAIGGFALNILLGSGVVAATREKKQTYTTI